MLQTPEQYAFEEINKKSWEITEQYVIQPNDLISVEVFTNKGERIIDPDFELSSDMNINQMDSKPKIKYQINNSGVVKLPMVGDVKLSGFDLRSAEGELETKYKEYYNEPFVNITYLNKPIISLWETIG
jgi:polysaccharide export outer membrane protein